ncbi:Cytospin-A [Clonorchis sinensis]|uniref:Cytospin-A n=3 Tax=Clonorchis sinensis TaxID=79923 RepID=A0A8T1M119_CLOSI|nr:Cytospin-A [Clonorchis sinensis]
MSLNTYSQSILLPMPVIANSQKPRREAAPIRPNSSTVRTTNSASSRSTSQGSDRSGITSQTGRSLRKSFSFQNLKAPTPFKPPAAVPQHNGNKSATVTKRSGPLRQPLHGSAVNLPGVCAASKSGNDTFSNPKSRANNADRISANSDLLSRVEKEKKQYEARISELTQLTETRKMEIEKLTFEVRRAKEEANTARTLAEEMKQENLILRSRIVEGDGKKDEDEVEGVAASESTQVPRAPILSPPSNPLVRKPGVPHQSPPESLGTTTRLTPGGVTTPFTGTVTMSSMSGDWNEPTLSLDLNSAADCGASNYSHDMTGDNTEMTTTTRTAETRLLSNPPVSVATLQGRLLQMEEANYTTNEELQATLQELWDLQRSVDEAHEEAHNLAFERAILLEALSTQTSKLEHCRFQIEQLKHLLLTDRRAQTPGSREHHFCELYASVEQEKQVLLSQNNDLAQSNDGLARECRVLTEKVSQLQDNVDNLELENSNLKGSCQKLSTELTALRTKNPGDATNGSSVEKRDGPSESQTKTTENKSGISVCDCPVCGCPDGGNAQLQLKLIEVQEELKEARDKFELLQSEREREATEWRLYERDLLKTVQIADGIKSESEAEALRLLEENAALKGQVDKLSREATCLSSELALLKDKLDSIQDEPIRPMDIRSRVGTDVTTNGGRMEDAEDSARKQQQSLHLPTRDFVSSAKSLQQTTIADGSSATYPGRPSSYAPYGSAHIPAPFSRASHLRPYTGSPGAPMRPSCLTTTGPTVRSLIQSIENQVKAVQQQKRGLTSNTQKSLTSSSPSPPKRLLTRVQSNPTPSGDVRSNGTNGLMSSSNGGSTTKSSKMHSTSLLGSPITLSQFPTDEENSSAPGGPGSVPPVLHEPAKSKFSLTPESVSSNPRRIHAVKSQISDPGAPPILDKNTYNATEKDSITSQTFSPPRGTVSFHGGLELASQNTGQPSQQSCAGSKHPSLERSLSPPNFTNPRRYSTEPTAAKKSTCDSLDAHGSIQKTAVDSSMASSEPSSSGGSSAFSSVHHLCQDPLQELARRTQAGSKRNALLLWCQSRVSGYRGVEVTNFSSSWNNGLALCALLHTYIPSEIPWNELVTPNGLPVDKKRCFEVAFRAAERDGIQTTLHLQDMLATERPDWNAVMSYVTSIYRRYEVPLGIASHSSTTNMSSNVSGVLS